MHLFNIFKALSPNSSSQSAGEAGAEPSRDPLSGLSRKRRRLKRRSTKHSATGSQPEEAASLSGIRIPDRNEGFRSAPNLLAESLRPVQDIQSRSWSPNHTIPRQPTPMDPSRLRENFSERRSWTSYERPTESPYYAEPPLDDQISALESPIFGPQEQGLFRNEMPYDMESPLSQLASGWRGTPRYIPRKLPDPPIPPQQPSSAGEMAYGTPRPKKEIPFERRQSPPPPQRTVSPESFHRRDSRSRHTTTSSDTVDGTYYVVPKGMNVIFQHEDGTEITRVGDFDGRGRSPIVAEDGQRRGSHRTSDVASSPRRGEADRQRSSRRTRHNEEEFGYERRSRSAEPRTPFRNELPTIILIDRSGRQIPIMPVVSDRFSG